MKDDQNNKISYITVDLSTTVKPIAISEEDAIKKAKADNENQAQYKDDDIETVETNAEEALKKEEAASLSYKSPEAEEVARAMEEENKKINQESFHMQNDLLKQENDKGKMNKQAAIILGIVIAIIVLILIIELPSFIQTFSG